MSRNDWVPLRTVHRDTLADMARSGVLGAAPGIRADRLRAFVDDYLTGRSDDHLAVWRLYTGWRWLESCRTKT